MKFTSEEIEEMRLADEEIERDFRWTNDELAASRRRDTDILLSRKSKRDRSIAEKQRAYYEANKDSIAEYQRAYRKANKDSIAERQRAYRKANKDSIAEYRRAYRNANKDSIAEYQRAYYEANKDSIAEKQRAYYEANKDSIAEKQRAYRKANKDSIAEKQRAYYEANKDSIVEKQQWIRHKRLNLGYSQYELAEAIGSSQAMISRLESGEMKLETFFAKDALCAVLGARL